MKKNVTLAAIMCLLAATGARAASDEPITDVAGTVKTYTKTFIMWSYGMMMPDEISEEDVEIVYGDDGKVYFKDFSQPSDTYIEGQIEGDKIIVELPQVDYNDGYSDYMLNLLVEVAPPSLYADFAEVWYGLPESDTEEIKTAVFTIADDGTITWDNPENACALGTVPVPDYMGMGATMAFTSLSFTPEGNVGIAEITNKLTVDRVNYYDLNGRQIAYPSSNGVYIRVSTLSNGEKLKEKVLVK